MSKCEITQDDFAASILASFALICSQTSSAISFTSMFESMADNPSVTIVEQNGHPTATVSATVAASYFARMILTLLLPSGTDSSIHIWAPPAPQQKEPRP